MRDKQKPKSDKGKAKTGPKPQVLKLEGNWEDAVTKALRKKKPPGGWPK